MNRIVVALVSIVVALGTLWAVLGREWRRTATDPTREIVRTVADRLDGQVERGRYRRATPEAIPERDQWNRALRVEYRSEGVAERLIVTSAGPDGLFDTKDDIRANRFLTDARAIGQGLARGAGSAAREAVGEAIHDRKERVREMFRRKEKLEEPSPPSP